MQQSSPFPVEEAPRSLLPHAWGAAGFARRGPSRGARDPLRVPTREGQDEGPQFPKKMPPLTLSLSPRERGPWATVILLAVIALVLSPTELQAQPAMPNLR